MQYHCQVLSHVAIQISLWLFEPCVCFRNCPYEDSSISTSSTDTEDSLDFIPTTPDGGWGWVVCFASFMIMVIMDGILFSFGVIFLELVEHFRESKGKTALVGSVCMGVHLIIGKQYCLNYYLFIIEKNISEANLFIYIILQFSN